MNASQRYFFFKFGLRKENPLAHYRELCLNQTLPVDALEALHWAKTRALLDYARRHVPYYRDLFRRIGLDPRDIVHPADYEQVPVLTRDLVRRHFHALISEEAAPGDLTVVATGGTTGAPVKVCYQRRVNRAVLGWRVLSWWGLPPDCHQALIGRDSRLGWRQKACQRAIWWPTRKLYFNATSYTDRDIRRFLDRFNRLRPPYVHGYVGTLDHMASVIRERGVTIQPPRLILATAAPISKLQECHIEEAFGCPVYDQYGSSEVLWIASECPARRGLHIFHDARKVEFLDRHHRAVAAGDFGDTAITDLENRFFPLIRYLNGDQGRRLVQRCDCGINLPLMDKVKGRISDIMSFPNGYTLSGEYLTTLFDNHPDQVDAYRIHQHRDASVTLLVAPRSGQPAIVPLLERHCHELADKIGHGAPVRYQIVDQIPDQGGKLQFVTSDLDPPDATNRPRLAPHGGGNP